MRRIRRRDEVAVAREPVAGDGVDTRREPVAARDPAVGAGGRGFGGLGELAIILARIVQLITAVIVIIILLGIALVLLDANAGNSIVSTIHDAGSSLVGPFKDIFSDKDPKVSLAENWGIAAIVYLIIGSVIASAISRLAVPRGRVR